MHEPVPFLEELDRATESPMEQRRTRRYNLQFPLSIARFGSESEVLQGVTKNISSRGVLFISETALPLDSRIHYAIHWKTQPEAVNLRCVGKVLRIDKLENPWGEGPPAYQVAATLERYEFLRGDPHHTP